jgi:polysaccharide export outer membrane protein
MTYKFSFAILMMVVFVPNLGAQEPTDRKNLLAQNYRIGVGDVIDVVVSQNERLSRNGIRVNNTGGIQLPMMDNDMPAACMTERELADAIRDKYRKYLVEPYVNVTVKEFNASPVALIGAVNAPGRFQLQRPVRLLELLAFVNGVKQNADEVFIVRSQRMPYCEDAKLVIPPDIDDELITLPVQAALDSSGKGNLWIRAGDVIRIDEKVIERAYVIGNVRMAKEIQLDEPVTLSQAIAMVGGFVDGADQEKIRIKRRTAGSLTASEIVVNYKEINQRKRDDVMLQPNDIVEVPGPTGGKKLLRDIMKTIVPTVTQLPMRVVY